MQLHLVDATYELFRAHYAPRPPTLGRDGVNLSGVSGIVDQLLFLLREEGATHVGCATDHVIESFRNDMYAGYKSSAGMPPELLSQFSIAEDAIRALGLVVWPMIEFEADDAIAAACVRFAPDPDIEQVLVCTPDKDMAQLVDDSHVVLLDRRRRITYDEEAVIDKWGVRPASIPDWLALVGDSADGFPGVRGWGEKAAAGVLSQYSHLEDIPKDWQSWHPSIKRAKALATSLFESWDDALLFRRLATLRLDVPVFDTVEDLRWKGPRADFEEYCYRIQSKTLFGRATKAASKTKSKP